MPVLYAKVAGTWTPINFTTPPEVFIGNTVPAGNETMWIDTSTTPPTTKAFVSGAWVTVGAIAPDEVWVGPNDPGNSAVELWYDTDDATPVLQTGLSSGLDAARPLAPTVPMLWFSTDTRRKWLWDGARWLFDGGSIPRMSAQRATGQAVANTTAATITFPDGEYYDPDNAFDGTTFTCKIAGMYLATCLLYIPAVASAGGFETIILRNSNGADRYGWHKVYIPANADWSLITAAQIPLVVGDFINVTVYHSAGVTRNVGAVPWSSLFTVTWIGAV